MHGYCKAADLARRQGTNGYDLENTANCVLGFGSSATFCGATCIVSEDGGRQKKQHLRSSCIALARTSDLLMAKIDEANDCKGINATPRVNGATDRLSIINANNAGYHMS
mmetsp:Transcript_2957/g.9069  ORF Transcript_2957/g.9069 Transcript_2957/m.9069 type:complete len:110 (+) Transcript_2957:204-533(+)|eukprot:scaffold151752_cov33-Tisochrysis_lutea.AAC.2